MEGIGAPVTIKVTLTYAWTHPELKQDVSTFWSAQIFLGKSGSMSSLARFCFLRLLTFHHNFYEQPVDAAIDGQFRVKGSRHRSALAHQDR